MKTQVPRLFVQTWLLIYFVYMGLDLLCENTPLICSYIYIYIYIYIHCVCTRHWFTWYTCSGGRLLPAVITRGVHPKCTPLHFWNGKHKFSYLDIHTRVHMYGWAFACVRCQYSDSHPARGYPCMYVCMYVCRSFLSRRLNEHIRLSTWLLTNTPVHACILVQ